MLSLNRKQSEELIAHAKKELPNEACGILAGRDGKIEKIYRMTNAEKSPEFFVMDSMEQLKVSKEIRSLGFEMLGIYHSHPHSQAYPSGKDVELAYAPDVSFVIVSLQDEDSPSIRSFKIIDGKITEEDLRITGD